MASSLKIAIIEDHNDLRHELHEMFFMEGYVPVSFSNAESLRKTRASFELYLIDIGLPGEDGLSLAQWIRDNNQDARIIILTAHDENQKRIESFSVGVELFLAKPVDPVQLMNAVAIVCGNTKARQSTDAQLVLDTSNRNLTGLLGSVKLSSSETALVKSLVQIRRLPLTVSDVAEILNVEQDHANTGTVESRISILRKKFVKVGALHNAIASVRKFGYKINVKIDLR